MTLQRMRHTLRLHRFELIAFGGALVVLSAAAFVISSHIEGLTPDLACFRNDGSALPAGCEAALRAFFGAQNVYGTGVLSVLLVLSLTVGLFIGVPVVARELERGTARLAWSLAPSRWRWYLANVLPLTIIVAILTFMAGVAIDRYYAVSSPQEDLANSFTGYGIRGGWLASQAVLVFAVAVVVGAVVGRALPAVIVAAVVATAGLVGGDQLHQLILRSEAVLVETANVDYEGDLVFEQLFQLEDGSLVGWEYFGNRDPFDENGVSRYPEFTALVPGTQYRFVETRMAILLAGATVVTLVIGGSVVSRRRPG